MMGRHERGIMDSLQRKLGAVRMERDEYQSWIRVVVEYVDSVQDMLTCFWCGFPVGEHDDGCPDERLREIAKDAP